MLPSLVIARDEYADTIGDNERVDTAGFTTWLNYTSDDVESVFFKRIGPPGFVAPVAM